MYLFVFAFVYVCLCWSLAYIYVCVFRSYGLYVYVQRIVPQRQEPSSCWTNSSLVWQRWQRLRLRCLEPPRDEDGDADKDDDEDSSLSGSSPTLTRLPGETSLSDSEARDTKRKEQKIISSLIFIFWVVFTTRKCWEVRAVIWKSGWSHIKPAFRKMNSKIFNS